MEISNKDEYWILLQDDRPRTIPGVEIQHTMYNSVQIKDNEEYEMGLVSVVYPNSYSAYFENLYNTPDIPRRRYWIKYEMVDADDYDVIETVNSQTYYLRTGCYDTMDEICDELNDHMGWVKNDAGKKDISVRRIMTFKSNNNGSTCCVFITNTNKSQHVKVTLSDALMEFLGFTSTTNSFIVHTGFEILEDQTGDLNFQFSGQTPRLYQNHAVSLNVYCDLIQHTDTGNGTVKQILKSIPLPYLNRRRYILGSWEARGNVEYHTVISPYINKFTIRLQTVETTQRDNAFFTDFLGYASVYLHIRKKGTQFKGTRPESKALVHLDQTPYINKENQ